MMQSTSVCGHTFTVGSRYDFKDGKVLGMGSFGVVVTAKDTENDNIEIAGTLSLNNQYNFFMNFILDPHQ